MSADSEWSVVGVVFTVPRYGFKFFSVSHLGPDGVDTQTYALPHLINWKGPDVCCDSGFLISTSSFSVSLAGVRLEKNCNTGGQAMRMNNLGSW